MTMRWWRPLTVPLAAALVVVGCGAGGGRGPSATSTAVVVPPAPVRAGPLVGAVPSGDLATELARLDRRTLAPLAGGRLRLEGTWPMLAVAPDRTVAVLGSDDGHLEIVDLVHLRRLGALRTQPPGLAASGWSWVGSSRLLLFGTAGETATEVLAVDLRARRVVPGSASTGWCRATRACRTGWPCSPPPRTRSAGRGWWSRTPTPACAR